MGSNCCGNRDPSERIDKKLTSGSPQVLAKGGPSTLSLDNPQRGATDESAKETPIKFGSQAGPEQQVTQGQDNQRQRYGGQPQQKNAVGQSSQKSEFEMILEADEPNPIFTPQQKLPTPMKSQPMFDSPDVTNPSTQYNAINLETFGNELYKKFFDVKQRSTEYLQVLSSQNTLKQGESLQSDFEQQKVQTVKESVEERIQKLIAEKDIDNKTSPLCAFEQKLDQQIQLKQQQQFQSPIKQQQQQLESPNKEYFYQEEGSEVQESFIDDMDDPLQYAADTYFLTFPFQVYNEATLPSKVQGNISLLHFYEDEGPQINDSIICINEKTIRLYRRKVDYINDPEQPLIQIPVNAIDEVLVDSINPEYLDLNLNDTQTQQFLQGSFSLKLKEDFLCLFMDNFSHNGLEDESLELAKQGKLKIDKNTEVLVHYYQFLERQTLGIQDAEASVNDKKLESFFKQDSNEAQNLRHHLLNRILIFSCSDINIRQQYIDCFKFVCENGENWCENVDLNETIDQDFNEKHTATQRQQF